MRASEPAPADPWPTLDEILTSLLRDDELEELVCVYLQNRFGYLVRPAPRGSRVDYVLRHPDRAVATVRVRARVPRFASVEALEHVYAFPPVGDTPGLHVTELDYEDFVDFIRSERWSLPLGVADWVNQAADA